MRQLDLFGFSDEEPKPAMEPAAVAVKRPPAAETVVAPAKPALPPAAEEKDVIIIPLNLFSALEQEEAVPTPQKIPAKIPGKRGRKSFKDIDAELNLVEVPDDEELFKKMYYPISEVAKWFNVNTSLVRFWENEFDILKPRKNRKGDRLFRPEDIKNLQVIHYLLRQRKFSIEGAKKYLKQNKSKAEVNIQLIQSLTRFRSFLLEMKANLGA
jgi:DNA-binding transcriptional MerR regulator